MKKEFENPVWSALTETHKDFAISYKGVKFYQPEVCNFGAIESERKVRESLDQYAKLTNDFYVVGQQLHGNDNLVLNKEVPCYQMVLDKLVEPEQTCEIIKLDNAFIDEVYDLIWLVMPGYYKKHTFHLGSYYGVFVADELVAVTGERLQSNTFIEVSAVVTHPNFTRQGYAKQLVAHTTKKILEKNKTPILHVATYNEKAIALYKSLGYHIGQTIVWNHFVSKGN